MIERFLLWLVGHRCPLPLAPVVRLWLAVFCLDCGVITEAVNDYCSRCGARSLLRLSNVLDRERVR